MISPWIFSYSSMNVSIINSYCWLAFLFSLSAIIFILSCNSFGILSEYALFLYFVYVLILFLFFYFYINFRCLLTLDVYFAILSLR